MSAKYILTDISVFENYFLYHDNLVTAISDLDISEDTKNLVIGEIQSIRIDDFVDSFKLGELYMKIYMDHSKNPDKNPDENRNFITELNLIIDASRNLDLIPIVNIKGNSVH